MRAAVLPLLMLLFSLFDAMPAAMRMQRRYAIFSLSSSY